MDGKRENPSEKLYLADIGSEKNVIETTYKSFFFLVEKRY